MNEEHVLDLLPEYSLGSLEEAETERVITHMAGCDICRREAESYLPVVSRLGFAAPVVEPPAGLREKILARAQESRRQPAGQGSTQGRFSIGKLAAALVVVLLAASNLFLWRQVNDLQAPPARFLSVTLSGSEAFPQATGVLIINDDGRYGTLVVDDMPQLDEGQVYQLWLIDEDGMRISGGTLDVSRSGYGALEVWSEEPLSSFPAFGITIEPEGGSPQPTGERVLAGEI